MTLRSSDRSELRASSGIELSSDWISQTHVFAKANLDIRRVEPSSM